MMKTMKLGASVAVIATALSLSSPASAFAQARSRSGTGSQTSGDSSAGQAAGERRGTGEAGTRTAQPRPEGGTASAPPASTPSAERGASGQQATGAVRPRSAESRGRVAVARPLTGPGSVPRPSIPIYRYPYAVYPSYYYGGYPAYGFYYDMYGRLVPHRHFYGAGWYAPYDYYYGPYGYGTTYVEIDRRDDDDDEEEEDARLFGSLRLRVNPKQARVYVDGALAGTVDDFDGLKDHLRIEAGRHEIQFRADGRDTVSMTIDVDAGKTTTLRASLKDNR